MRLLAGQKAAYWWIFGKQAIPIKPIADMNRAEKLGDCRRGEQGFGRNTFSHFTVMRVEYGEFSGEYLNRTDHQMRRTGGEQGWKLAEIYVLLDDFAEVFLTDSGQLVGTDFGEREVAGAALQPDKEVVGQGVRQLARGHFVPERFKQLRTAFRVALE